MNYSSPVAKRNNNKITEMLNISGRILFWTKIYVPPIEFEHEAPYYVALVQLKDGVKCTLQLTDFTEEPRDQQEIICVMRRLGKSSPSDIIRYCIKAKPL